MIDYVTTYCNEPCVFSAAEFLRNRFESLAHENLESPELHQVIDKGDPDPKLPQPDKLSRAHGTSLCISHLDHIRSETKYFKKLKCWSQELSICGKVIDAGVHFVYVILVGRTDSLQELLHRWRTTLIDIDSRGRPCKERLMSILCHQQVDGNQLSDRFNR